MSHTLYTSLAYMKYMKYIHMVYMYMYMYMCTTSQYNRRDDTI